MALLAANQSPPSHPAHDLRWLAVLRDGLAHEPLLIEASGPCEPSRHDTAWPAAMLPLALVKGPIFGRFLVSLPYTNTAGVMLEGASAAQPAASELQSALVSRACELADELRVKFLELRHETAVEHERLVHRMTSKVHMRLALPATADALWSSLKAKVRNQVRKSEKHGFSVHWGSHELLDDFYDVFSRNMRDLGTPVFSRRLFAAILRHFGSAAELCILRDGARPAAAALLVHGASVTEVPSASTLRDYNSACANMLLYWQLLSRAVERAQAVFDFGRSSVDSGTFQFKKQWGAEPHPAVWQYYVRHGDVSGMRPDSPKYRRMVAAWQKLPLWLTRLAGPTIVRGIP